MSDSEIDPDTDTDTDTEPAAGSGAQPRWFTDTPSGHSERYVARFRALAADGADLDGEARFVDALLPRGARVLDAGCGPGRVGAALHARGHVVVGVDADPVLIAAAAADHPGPSWTVADLATAELGALTRNGATFDAIVLAGNVMVFLAPGTERTVLTRLAELLGPEGMMITGFATDRGYGLGQFDRDAQAAGLSLVHRFATWDLRRWHDDADWVVSVLRRV